MLHRIRQYFQDKEVIKIHAQRQHDMAVYGQSAFESTRRHHLNPMKYILGPVKLRRINPMDIIIRGYGK
jgi:hypothetical protein